MPGNERKDQNNFPYPRTQAADCLAPQKRAAAVWREAFVRCGVGFFSVDC
jgi:hypothetical protein